MPSGRSTSFCWRHRLLPGAARSHPALLGSVVETDETYQGLRIRDGAAAYRRVARDAGLRRQWVDVRAAIHVQNVDGWHAPFKGWLIHYCGWQRVLDDGWLTTAAQPLLAAVEHG